VKLFFRNSMNRVSLGFMRACVLGVTLYMGLFCVARKYYQKPKLQSAFCCHQGMLMGIKS